MFTIGLDVQDYGNVSYTAEKITDIHNMTHLGDVAGCTSRVSEMVQQALKDKRRVVTLGGDHSVGIGTIDGHVKVCILKSSVIFIQIFKEFENLSVEKKTLSTALGFEPRSVPNL